MKLCFIQCIYCFFGSLYHLKPLTACKLVSTTGFNHNKCLCFLRLHNVLISLVTQVFLSVTVEQC